MVQNGSVFSEKIRFLNVHDLGPRSRNDLDLQYSHTFIKSFSCLYLPTFRSQASIGSEKSTVLTFFPIEKPKFLNLTLPLNRSRSLQVHRLKNYDVLESRMLHTKFRGNRPVGSGEEDF